MEATEEPTWYETTPTDKKMLALVCPVCCTGKEKRRDSFLPGAHVAICTHCGFASSRIALMNGSVVAVTHRSRSGGG